MQPEGSARGGKRLFLTVTFGGVPAKVMIDSGAELNVVSGIWVSDNIESIKAWVKKCAKYWVRGITPGSKIANDRMLSGIPLELVAQGAEDFKDKTSLRIVNMGQNDEYDIILGISWLEQYRWCKPFQITTENRGLCMDILEVGEELPELVSDSEDESEMPTLSFLEEGEEPEAGVFRMSPLEFGVDSVDAVDSSPGSSVASASDSRCESDLWRV